MPNLKEGMKLIGGMEPTPEQIQRIQAIALSFDIPMNDALFPFLVALDTYHGIFTRLPKEVASMTTISADAAAANAASQAKSKVDVAVAALVPSISDAVFHAAGSAIRLHQLGRSMLTIWGAMVFTGFVFSFGWFVGAHALPAAMSHKFPWAIFWGNAGLYIGLGICSFSLILLGGLKFVDDRGKPEILGWGLIAGGVLCTSTLIGKAWSS